MFSLEADRPDSSSQRDEIRRYIDSRYVCASEAFARLMGWHTHKVCSWRVAEM